MNSEQAKKLSLPDLLEKLGYQPVKEQKNGYELWYRSPFRQENEPSFHTSFLGGKWIWNDFGDSGGTIIDFVMRYQNYTTISQVLDYLEQQFKSRRRQEQPSTLFSFQQQRDREAVENFSEPHALELLSAEELHNSVLIQYLTQQRGINAALLPRYLHEVRYRNTETGKEYFAFGMKNEAGGYEIRVATNRYSFKSALPSRDVTRIVGKISGQDSVTIFEGMTDFLSLLTLRDIDQPNYDAIIMHSLTSYQRTASLIRTLEYQQIHTYLDNNPAGQETTERFKRDFGNKVMVQSTQFAPHIDLNDALRASQSRRRV